MFPNRNTCLDRPSGEKKKNMVICMLCGALLSIEQVQLSCRYNTGEASYWELTFGKMQMQLCSALAASSEAKSSLMSGECWNWRK